MPNKISKNNKLKIFNGSCLTGEINMKYSNLVFEGGGVKGIAYVGVLEAITTIPLKRHEEPINLKQDIKRVAGTSAGAITALLVSLNYNVDEIKKELSEVDFNKFADKPTWKEWLISLPYRYRGEHYIYEGTEFLSWIHKVIEKKLGKATITFKELKEYGCKELYIIGTNLTKRKIEIFSSEHTPNMPIDIAVRASMAIPFIFKGVRFSIDNKAYDPNGKDIYVDGGVISNYPIEIFDNKKYIIDKEYSDVVNRDLEHSLPTPPRYLTCLRTTTISALPEPIGLYRFINAETLGFKVDSKDEIDRYSKKIEEEIKEEVEDDVRQKINSLWNYTESLASLFYNSQDIIRGKTENLRTVYIDSQGISTTKFSLTKEDKNALIDSGHNAWALFRDNYSSAVDEWKKDNKELHGNSTPAVSLTPNIYGTTVHPHTLRRDNHSLLWLGNRNNTTTISSSSYASPYSFPASTTETTYATSLQDITENAIPYRATTWYGNTYTYKYRR